MTRRLVAVLLVGVLALSVAACGKRASPEPPPGDPNTYPRAYPVDRG